ncbi:MAG: glycosyltransferase family 39 protein [bacterium]
MPFGKPVNLILMLGLLLLLIYAGSIHRDLTFPDELRYAEVAREMLESGNWILPKFNYAVYPDKPPVFFWALASSMKLLGENTRAALLPSMLSAILTLFMTYLLGKEIFHHEAGLYGAWILGSFFLFLMMSQVVRMDMTMTALVTASHYFFYKGFMQRGRSRRTLLAGYLCIGTALITKGPVGLILPLVTILSYLLLRKEPKRIKSLYTFMGLLLMLGIPLVWLGLASLQGGGAYLREILLKQSTGRVIESFSHAKPLYYYFLYFPLLFVPWSFFLVLFFDPGIRKDLSVDRDGNLFLICWVLGALIFFSLISGKILIYLLPIAPALALLIARIFHPILKDPGVLQRPMLFKLPAYLLAGIYIVGAFGIYAAAGKVPFLKDWRDLVPLFLVLIPGGVILSYHARRMHVLQSFTTIGLISVFMVGSMTLWLLPRINPYLSLKPMARQILSIHKDHPQVAGYKVDLRYLTFYLKTPYDKLNSYESLRTFMEKKGAFLVADQEDVPLLREALQRPLIEIGQFPIKGLCYLVFLIQ